MSNKLFVWKKKMEQAFARKNMCIAVYYYSLIKEYYND